MCFSKSSQKFGKIMEHIYALEFNYHSENHEKTALCLKHFYGNLAAQDIYDEVEPSMTRKLGLKPGI